MALATSWCRRFRRAEREPGIPRRAYRYNRPGRSRNLLRTLRHDCIANRYGLRCRRLLPRLLWHRLLLDADEWFSIGTIEDVDPAGATGLRDPLSRFAVDHSVEQDYRARRIVVPEVVVYLLEVPDIFPGLG